MHVPRQAGREKEAVADFFNNAVDAREEGVIVKAVNSHYQVVNCRERTRHIFSRKT